MHGFFSIEMFSLPIPINRERLHQVLGDEVLERLLNGDGTTSLIEDGAVPDVPADAGSKTGDVCIQVSIVCCTATVLSDVERLMNG